MNAAFEKELAPLKQQLIDHPLYSHIASIDELKIFMEQHVFAVWDFMSLVKKLQISLTCTSLPWKPSKYPTAGRLINEIVWGEETDLNKDGAILSHFEMYLQAMEETGANTQAVNAFIDGLEQDNLYDRILSLDAPQSVKNFLQFTFDTIASEKLHVIAAVFTFGREDLIPDMFIEMVKNLKKDGNHLNHLIYYLERHIEVDGDEHGPMALEMIKELCEDNPLKIEEALTASKEALHYRIALWDGVYNTINKTLIQA